jgi:predicted ATPase with chaperone activity
LGHVISARAGSKFKTLIASHPMIDAMFFLNPNPGKVSEMHLGIRACGRILKVSRTIADIDHESIQYRTLDRNLRA